MNRILSKAVGGCLAVIVSATTTPLIAQQSNSSPQNAPSQSAPAGQTQLPPVELPENPGANSSASANSGAGQTAPVTNAPSQTPAPQQPSGTAVAPPVEVTGGAASKPAGVAIAPPKQRQIRSLLIKLGLIAGAGVAVGTVVGLSAASPGHVPNSGH